MRGLSVYALILIEVKLCFPLAAENVGENSVVVQNKKLQTANIDIDDMLQFDSSNSVVEYDQLQDWETMYENINNCEAFKNKVERNSQSLSDKQQKHLKLFQQQVKQYVARYINLLMTKLDLQTAELTEPNSKDIKVDLEFVISQKDLVFLKNFSNNLKSEKVQEGLYKIDKILERGLQRKKESCYFPSGTFWDNLLSSDYFRSWSLWMNSKSFYYQIFFIASVIVLLLKRNNFISIKLMLFMIICNYIFLEGLLNYDIKKKEAEIVDHIQLLQNVKMPDDCDPNKRTMWSTILSYFGESDCLRYHKILALKKVDEISPLKCILETYIMYLFEIPAKTFGSIVGNITISINESLPGILRHLATPITASLVLIFIIGVMVCVMRPRARIGFFGASLEISFSNSGEGVQVPLIQRSEERIGYEQNVDERNRRIEEIEGPAYSAIEDSRRVGTEENDLREQEESSEKVEENIEVIGEGGFKTQEKEKVQEDKQEKEAESDTSFCVLEEVRTVKKILKDLRKE